MYVFFFKDNENILSNPISLFLSFQPHINFLLLLSSYLLCIFSFSTSSSPICCIGILWNNCSSFKNWSVGVRVKGNEDWRATRREEVWLRESKGRKKEWERWKEWQKGNKERRRWRGKNERESKRERKGKKRGTKV